MASPVYPSDLTDAEWIGLSSLLPPAKPGGRPRSVSIRRIVNGLFYLVRAGCAWRSLPRLQHIWADQGCAKAMLVRCASGHESTWPSSWRWSTRGGAT